MMLIFLDCDGAGLNDHTRHDNGYCGGVPCVVAELNWLLAAVPDARIVLTSAWRYFMLNGEMTLKGLESLLLTHGVNCHGRLLGITGSDEFYEPSYPDFRNNPAEGCEIRVLQIVDYHGRCSDATGKHLVPMVVIDDLPLPGLSANLVQTDGAVGLTRADAERAVVILEAQRVS